MAFNKNCLAKLSKCYICGDPSCVEVDENKLCQECFKELAPVEDKKILKNKITPE